MKTSSVYGATYHLGLPFFQTPVPGDATEQNQMISQSAERNQWAQMQIRFKCRNG